MIKFILWCGVAVYAAIMLAYYSLMEIYAKFMWKAWVWNMRNTKEPLHTLVGFGLISIRCLFPIIVLVLVSLFFGTGAWLLYDLGGGTDLSLADHIWICCGSAMIGWYLAELM